MSFCRKVFGVMFVHEVKWSQHFKHGSAQWTPQNILENISNQNFFIPVYESCIKLHNNFFGNTFFHICLKQNCGSENLKHKYVILIRQYFVCKIYICVHSCKSAKDWGLNLDGMTMQCVCFSEPFGRGFRCRLRARSAPEEKTEAQPHDIHCWAAWGAGESFWAHTLPRHLHTRGARPKSQTYWGESAGTHTHTVFVFPLMK